MVDRTDAIVRIRAALKAKTGKAWSVRGNTGTSWGWIDVLPAPKDQPAPGRMTVAQAAELAQAFGLADPVHFQGLSIPPNERSDYVARVERGVPAKVYAPKASRLHAASRAAFSQVRAAETHPACCGCSDCPP